MNELLHHALDKGDDVRAHMYILVMGRALKIRARALNIEPGPSRAWALQKYFEPEPSPSFNPLVSIFI